MIIMNHLYLRIILNVIVADRANEVKKHTLVENTRFFDFNFCNGIILARLWIFAVGVNLTILSVARKFKEVRGLFICVLLYGKERGRSIRFINLGFYERVDSRIY